MYVGLSTVRETFREQVSSKPKRPSSEPLSASSSKRKSSGKVVNISSTDGAVVRCGQASKLADPGETDLGLHAAHHTASATPPRTLDLPQLASPSKSSPRAAGSAASSQLTPPKKDTREIGIITDLCNHEDPDEVEILSLIQDQIPRYRLRSDPFSDFGGYSHQDWIQTPLINLDTELDLTDLQISESLKYFILCAERVTQMTKTYNDIEAVTRLLEEKERDLELAARIGQTLLGKNKELSSRGDILDEQLNHAFDKINQLKHDLSMKDELLKFYCQDLQDQTPGDYSPNDGMANLSKINVDQLQRKVGTLEQENINLRLESAQLRSDTENYEDKEKKLVEDCLQQLADVNQQVDTFAAELKYKTEESCRQKEEMTSLLAQVADLHKRVRQLTIENMDLAEKLSASTESQRQLTKELSHQQDRYDELFEMLEDAQDELRSHRSRTNPKATRHLYASAHFPSASGGMDSLASELESSLHSLQQEDAANEEQDDSRRARNWKIFETARAARKAINKSSRDSSVRMSASASSWGEGPSQNTSRTPSNFNSDTESFSDGYNADMDSMYGSSTELGRPGIPGSNDLESALRRLAMRRANDLNERDFLMSHLQQQQDARDESSGSFRMSDTPDSVASPSSGYSYLGSSNTQHSGFKIPDKLQIVKPLEGSVTLRHWQRLAQPHLGGLFERREGVKVRGERKLDLEGEVYTLSDYEEDEDFVECPSRRMADSSTIYTFTNSMVSQPSQHNQNSQPGLASLSASGIPGSPGPQGTSTPTWQAGRKGGNTITSGTATMSLGLAAILQGREGGGTTRSLLRPIASCPVVPSISVAAAGSDPAAAAAAAAAAATGLSPSPSSSSLTSSASSTSLMGPDGSLLSGYTGNNAGLLGKLISTGYSMLWNKSETPVTVPTTSVSTSSTPTPTPTIQPATASEGARPKASAEQILPKSGATGVLGAMSNFRKNGML